VVVCEIGLSALTAKFEKIIGDVQAASPSWKTACMAVRAANNGLIALILNRGRNHRHHGHPVCVSKPRRAGKFLNQSADADRTAQREWRFHRRNSSRCELTGRALLRNATKASPTSWQRGRFAFSVILSCPNQQHPWLLSMSSIRERITSHARNPKRADKRATARSPYP
jgi:hypothetical protein